MTADYFEQELNTRCGTGNGRRYRLRWSDATHTWNVEQQVARATEVPVEGGDPDLAIRARDGYALVLQFSPSKTMRCPECRSLIELPILDIAEVRCDHCASRPDLYDRQMWFTGYFPLGERLLTYLERTAPKRGDAWAKEMDEENKRVINNINKRSGNLIEAIAADYWKQVAQIQQIGYGNGPASHGRL